MRFNVEIAFKKYVRATYISKTIQNELIACCKKEILAKIMSLVEISQFFSILFDETTDISNISQLTLG